MLPPGRIVPGLTHPAGLAPERRALGQSLPEKAIKLVLRIVLALFRISERSNRSRSRRQAGGETTAPVITASSILAVAWVDRALRLLLSAP